MSHEFSLQLLEASQIDLEDRWGFGRGGGGARVPGTLIYERRRFLVLGHLSVRVSMKGALRVGSFTGEPKS